MGGVADGFAAVARVLAGFGIPEFGFECQREERFLRDGLGGSGSSQ